MTTSASELVRGGQYEAGIAAAKQVLRRDERYVPAMIVMARAYYFLKKNELAGSICDIAKKIEQEMQYPGEIKVTVMREVRSVEYAR